MMKYNSKIFARSICAVMAGVMMVGGLTGCGNDDAVDGRGMRLEKQNGDKTEITGIAEKYREKESKQKKKSLQDNGLRYSDGDRYFKFYVYRDRLRYERV